MRRRVRNLIRIRAFRNAIKETRKLFTDGKAEEARALLPRVYQTLDKAAKSKVIKKNAAARAKSRLTKFLK